MGRGRRKKEAKRKGGLAKARPIRSGAAERLAEAVRRGQHRDFPAAERIARRAYENASSSHERARAGQVLAEACLHLGINSADPRDAERHLADAFRLTPSSARAAFYHALSLFLLGRDVEGREALESGGAAGTSRTEAFPSGIASRTEGPIPGALTYARQLLCLLSAQPVHVEELSARDAEELALLQRLLVPLDGPSTDPPIPTAPQQLTLFPPPGMAPPGRARAGASERVATAGLRLWRALLSLKEGGQAPPDAEFDEIAAQGPPGPAATILRYYRGVAAYSRGEREKARALWNEAALAGFDTPWLRHNLSLAFGGAALELAQQASWAEVLPTGTYAPGGVSDRVLDDVTALAHDHLGYDAARAGNWSKAAIHWRKAMELEPSRHLAQNLALAEEALERWEAAGDAWRAMVRRRPRSRSHPDYLSDQQVAAIWTQAADCYERADDFRQTLTCVETALKYAPDDMDLRLTRACLLMGLDSLDSAVKELDRILAMDPAHEEALRHRAILEEEEFLGDATPFWRRVLELVPRDTEAREALADWHMKEAIRTRSEAGSPQRALLRSIEILERGLEDVPGHPSLLLQLGETQRRTGQVEKARATLVQALEASDELHVVGRVLHELVHAAGKRGKDDVLEATLARARDLPGVTPEFWLEQASDLTACDLPWVWYERFLEEALRLTADSKAEHSRASILFMAYEAANMDAEMKVAKKLEVRIRKEEPESGAPELIDALRLLDEEHNLRAARRLFQAAAARAKRAQDPAMGRLIKEREVLLFSLDLKNPFKDLFEL